MESNGSYEFLLGIEEYLSGLGCTDQAVRVHNLAKSFASENVRNATSYLFLQNCSTSLGQINKPLADLAHKFSKAQDIDEVRLAVLSYVMQDKNINIHLKDFIFRIVKEEDSSLALLTYLMKLESIDQNLKDLIFKITKDAENASIPVLSYIMKIEDKDNNLKDLIFKTVKKNQDAKTALIHYLINEDFDQNLKDFMFKVIRKDNVIDCQYALLYYLGRTLEDKNLVKLSSALLKTDDNKNLETVFINSYLAGLEEEFPSDKLFRGINSCIKHGTVNQEILNDAFSRSQIKSKFWLIKELAKIQKPYNNVLVMAGWFGQIKSIYDKFLTYKKMRVLDLEQENCELSDYVFNLSNLENHKVKSIRANINELVLHKNGYEWTVENFKEPDKNYNEKFLPELIINTSAEHMTEDWFHQIRFKKLDSNPIVAIQSNNMFDIEEHLNCVHSIEHMKKKFPMREVLYEGELQLKGYKRVMLIGRP